MTRVPAPAALALLIAVATAASGQVGHRSVGCVMNGRDVPQCVCDGTCPGGQSPSSGPSGPQVSGQAVQAMQGAVEEQARQALGAMVNQLGQAQRAQTLQREAQQREQARQTGIKAMDAVHGMSPARRARSFPAPAAAAARRQSAALDCAMNEVFQAADALGSSGEAFTRALAEDAKRAKASLSSAAPDSSSDAYDVARFSRSSVKEGAHGDEQMVVDVVITRDRKTGETRLNTLYSMTRAGKKEDAGQSTLVLAPSGKVLCQQLSAATAECMSRTDPAAGDPDYCPKPPQ